MLKYIYYSGIILFLCTSISAQEIYKPDKRLYDCISSEDLNQMEASASELISYYNYYLDNSYYVVDLKTAEKKVTGTDIHSVKTQTTGTETSRYFTEKVYSKKTFNPLLYNFTLEMNSFTTYIWNEAGVAIIFYPLNQISDNYKNYIREIRK